MIKFRNTDVMNMHNALRGMRNPMKSWNKSDSCWVDFEEYDGDGCSDGNGNAFVVGENDMALCKKLRVSGSDHRKYLRQIFVSVDITAPLFWWKEYDTYKVATVANSESTMHTIHKKQFEMDDFSHERLLEKSKMALSITIDALNESREAYNRTNDKAYWDDMIQLLPSSFNQMRTCTLNYETLINIYHSRRYHRLKEWHEFCKWIETLPYAKELIIGE